MPRSRPIAHRLTLAQARRRWFVRQGLAEAAAGPPGEVLRTSGWLRTLGGIDVYLAARARVAGLRRADLDQAVEAGALKVVPAVRSCIYLVPAAEVPLVLRIAEEMWRPRTERELAKAGSSWQEVRDIADGIEAVLATGPHTTDSLRRALPAGLVRSLGEAGKKLGLSSPLPVALRLLELEGRIERRLADGRLDSERYLWRRPERPLVGGVGLADKEQRLGMLARIFLMQAAPATIKELAEWSGLSQKEARAAVESLPVEPVSIEGHAEEAWAFPADLAAAAEPAGPPPIAFLSFADNYLTVHGGPAALCDPSRHGMKVPTWGGTRGSTLGDAKFPSLRPVLLGAEVAGFWEYDPDAKRVVAATLEALPAAQAKRLVQATDQLTAFLRDQLGHGRSFNLDTDEALRERVSLVTAAGPAVA